MGRARTPISVFVVCLAALTALMKLSGVSLVEMIAVIPNWLVVLIALVTAFVWLWDPGADQHRIR